MSRKFAVVQMLCLALAVAVLALSPSASLAVVNIASVAPTGGDTYKDQIGSGSTAEGDIWGGEQGSEPEISPVGPSVGESLPLINTVPIVTKQPNDPVPNAGQAGWLHQLGGMFDWLLTSLRLITA